MRETLCFKKESAFQIQIMMFLGRHEGHISYMAPAGATDLTH